VTDSFVIGDLLDFGTANEQICIIYKNRTGVLSHHRPPNGFGTAIVLSCFGRVSDTNYEEFFVLVDGIYFGYIIMNKEEQKLFKIPCKNF
jgi:hypothetical protein